MSIENWRTNLPWPELETPSDIEYLYENENGETKNDFNNGLALAVLLMSETAFLNSNWMEKAWPDDAKETIAICINTNDIFMWACADAERISYNEIEEVYRYWVKDPTWGTAVWAIIRNKEMPQAPVEKSIREYGIWNLDELQKEHNLRPNAYDGISHIDAQHKYNTYIEWCRESGKEPLPFDVGWWEGWNEYVKTNPDWYNEEWKEIDKIAIERWYNENGYHGS